MFKIGFTSVTFKNETIETIFEALKKVQIDGIEWAENDNHFTSSDVNKIKYIYKNMKILNIETFSFGSYYNFVDNRDFEEILYAAKLLKAPIIRVWAGKKKYEELTNKEYQEICEKANSIANLAKKEKIKIGLEFHPYTLTDTASSAIKFLKDVGNDNLFLYWQPNENLDFHQNVKELKLVIPYLVGNIHIHNYVNDKFTLLDTVKDEIREYLMILKKTNKTFNIIIEFVKDNNIENFFKDVSTLDSICKS